MPSRAAENLYWFGRYGERCDAAARLLRLAIANVLGNTEARTDDASEGLLPTLALAGRTVDRERARRFLEQTHRPQQMIRVPLRQSLQ